MRNCGLAECEIAECLVCLSRPPPQGVQGEQVGAEAADDEAEEYGCVVCRQQAEDELDWESDQAVERGHGLKAQIGAGGIMQDRREIRRRMAHEPRFAHPPQVPNVLPAVKAVARDGAA